MRLKDGSAKIAGKRLDKNIARGAPIVGTFEVTRISFKIGDEIMVRSLSIAAHRTKTTIVGAVHGDFILMVEPVVEVNGRLLAVFDGTFEASYFTEGYRYNFVSRYRSHIFHDIVCIEYPKKAYANQVRKHRRIRVNIELKYAIIGTANWLSGDMLDISSGGCRVVMKSKTAILKGMKALMVFSLPNDAEISDLRAEVVRSRRTEDGETTEVGFLFSGPPGELAKIDNFCEFCLFFEVD